MMGMQVYMCMYVVHEFWHKVWCVWHSDKEWWWLIATIPILLIYLSQKYETGKNLALKKNPHKFRVHTVGTQYWTMQ